LRAFTLIEVLVSVMILFIAAGAFFSVTSNSMHLYDLFEKKKDFELYSTVPLTEEKGGKIKEILRDFKIKDDFVLENLNYEINFKKSVDLKEDFNGTSVILYRLKAFDRENMSKIYSIGIK